MIPIAVAFVHGAHAGWRRWGDLLIDTGRELELPRRMLAGEHLYTDLRYYYGPLAPYVNASLYGIFGVHADVLMFAGIASAALVALAVWLLTMRLAGRVGATVTTVVFIYVCAFPNLGAVAIFNFALPYTFAATYGILVALWSLVFLVRHADRGGTGALVASTALLALATFTKAETLAPALAAHGLFVLWLLVRRRFRVVPHLAVYGGALIGATAPWVWIAWRTGPTLWRDNLGGVVNGASRSFVLRMMGLADPAGSTTSLGLSILLVAITLLVLAGVARWEGPGAVRLAAIGATTAGIFACFAVWGIEYGLPVVPWVALGALVLPTFIPAANGGDASVTPADDRGDAILVRRYAPRSPELGFAILCAFAVVSLFRVFLRPLPDGYGFYLLTPALAVVGSLLFHHLPQRCATDRMSRDALVAGAIALLLGTATACFIASNDLYQAHTIEIATARGRILIRPDYEPLVELVDDLSRLPPNTGVMVVPEGLAVVFLAGQPSAGSMFSYLPMEIPDRETDEALARVWESDPADAVVFIDLTFDEFEYSGFGRDYAIEAFTVLKTAYVPVRQYGPRVTLLRPLR